MKHEPHILFKKICILFYLFCCISTIVSLATNLFTYCEILHVRFFYTAVFVICQMFAIKYAQLRAVPLFTFNIWTLFVFCKTMFSKWRINIRSTEWSFLTVFFLD